MASLKIVVACTNGNCGHNIRIPQDKHIRFACPKCGKAYEYDRGRQVTATTQEPATFSIQQELKFISINRLIRGFPVYARIFGTIVRNPVSFPRRFDLKGEEQFKKGFDYITYSIVILFALMLPTYFAHDLQANKFVFFVRISIIFLINCTALHLGLTLFGARCRWRYTASVFCFLQGTFFPVIILCMYPMMYWLGPEALFGTLQDMLRPRELPNESPIWFVLSEFLLLFLAITALIAELKWFSFTHRISKWRVFWGGALGSFASQILVLFVVNPALQYIQDPVMKVIKSF